MRAFGVVAEFNPFHEGHSYFLDKAKELTGSDVAVAAISGDLTQRGEPAVFDKWKRAELAVHNGVDLVLEIPTVYAIQSAPYFAKGGVGVLRGLGVLDYIAFGSESGDIDRLKNYASFIKDNGDAITDGAKELMKQGISYPAARDRVIRDMTGDSFTPSSNDILAIEYLNQDLGDMEPVAVRRSGAGHNVKASELREQYRKEHGEEYSRMMERLFDAISLRVITSSPDELEEIAGASGGLGNKLKNELRYASGYEELTDRLKSRIYTRTRVSRYLMNVILGIKEKDLDAPLYIRVLAMDDKGASLLKEARKSGNLKLPVISNINKDTDGMDTLQKNTISFDILGADVYNIIYGHDLYENCDMIKMPFKA